MRPCNSPTWVPTSSGSLVPGPARWRTGRCHEDHVLRGRTNVVADLKSDNDKDVVLALVASADVLIEGFRPGVMERLGLGPDVCTERASGWCTPG